MLRILFSDTKLLRNADTITLSKIKGKASMTMLSNIILKLIRLFQLIMSAILLLANKFSRAIPPRSEIAKHSNYHYIPYEKCCIEMIKEKETEK